MIEIHRNSEFLKILMKKIKIFFGVSRKSKERDGEFQYCGKKLTKQRKESV